MNTIHYGMDEREHATGLAALRYYQAAMATVVFPAIAEIATAGGLLRVLDEKEIEALCKRLNSDRPERINRKVREALRMAIRLAERELMNWKLDRVDDAEHRALRKALGRYQEAWNLLK